MKRLLYIALNNAFGNKSSSDGVSLKIFGQCKALMENGWDVWLLAYKDEDIVLYNINKEEFKEISNSKKKIRRIRIFDESERLVSQLQFKTVYIRYPYTDVWFLLMLRQLKKNVNSIYLELPTYPIERWGLQYGVGKFVISRLDAVFGRFLRNYVTQFRIMGSNQDEIYGVPAVNISNGIDCKEIQKKTLEGADDSFVIITVSRMNHYHGYDRLIEGLNEYYKNSNLDRKARVIMIGEGPMKDEWKRLTFERNMEEYVEFVGIKSKDELLTYFNQAHIAIGSLGLHRVGLFEISTLKSKEYCARGIPFAGSNSEIGFSEDFSYLIKLIPNDSSVDIQYLIDSYERIKRQDPNYINNMRSYAEETLSWKNQMLIDS
ncbi:glycosyltransferase [Virgibacillus sp. JSM 102003]|uniref:glycosyltransferase n=1 Tax=Virgibacillus sp. JSM 102003 TaxID=1562108 RepID=UPI0035C11C4F